MATIEKRGANSWRITVRRSVEGFMETHRMTMKGGRREAEKAAVEFEAKVLTGDVICSPKMVVGEYAQQWVDNHVRINLTPKTQVAYMQHLNQHILPIIGHIKLNELHPTHIVKLYAKLKTMPQAGNRDGVLSAKTIANIAAVLNRMLTDAVRWGLIPHNPAARVERPKKDTKESSFYDEEAIEALLVHLDALPQEELKYKVICYIALFTGFRLGEIMGLEWQDIDLDKNQVRVSRISQYVHGQGIITKTPKTKKSARTITIPAVLSVLLKQYKAEWNRVRLLMGPAWNATDRLFVAYDGSPMHPLTPSKWWHGFIRKNGLPIMTFHGLRHTSATFLFQKGINIEAISSRLGHRDATTFLKVYSHLFRTSDQNASDLFDNVIPLRRESQ